ncbi:MAG: cytochrome c biogenesis protein CcsA [Deltaproteobacteria bacterium]|nr:cytochrome c biogenesis protein CcsA [Deltaproteobacteria bacterium]
MFVALLIASSLAFVVATGLFLVRLLRVEVARSAAAEGVMAVATALLLGAALVGFELLGGPHGAAPLALLFVAVAASTTSLVVQRWGDFPLLGPITAALVAMVALALALHALFPPPTGPHVLRTVTILHIASTLIGYLLFVPAFALASLYVAQSWRIKTKQSSNPRLPSLVTLETSAWRLLTLGFVLYTLGIVGGALSQEGSGAGVRPPHVLAAISWIIYAVAIVRRHLHGWSGVRSAVTLLAGFVWTSGAVLLYMMR